MREKRTRAQGEGRLSSWEEEAKKGGILQRGGRTGEELKRQKKCGT